MREGMFWLVILHIERAWSEREPCQVWWIRTTYCWRNPWTRCTHMFLSYESLSHWIAEGTRMCWTGLCNVQFSKSASFLLWLHSTRRMGCPPCHTCTRKDYVLRKVSPLTQLLGKQTVHKCSSTLSTLQSSQYVYMEAHQVCAPQEAPSLVQEPRMCPLSDSPRASTLRSKEVRSLPLHPRTQWTWPHSWL